MPRRRRSYRRRFAGKRSGRNFFWYRYTPFGVPLVEAATATHAEVFLSESDWQNPISGINTTERGGPRLERIIVDFGVSLDADDAFWVPSGDGNIALIPEFMIWKQSDQFASVVTNSTSFSLTRQDQRVIMNEVPMGQREWSKDISPGARSLRSVQGRYESKSKVRLADGALGVAWRGLFDTGSANLNGLTDWVRPTLLISLP